MRIKIAICLLPIFQVLGFISPVIAVNAQRGGTVTRIYSGSKGIYFDTTEKKSILLIGHNSGHPNAMVNFSIEEILTKKDWTILSAIIGHEGPGRIC